MTATVEKAVRLRRPLLWVVVAIAGLIVVNAQDSGLVPTQDKVLLKAVSLAGTLLFLIGGVLSVRRIAGYVDARFRRRGLGSAGSVLAVVISAAGYCVVVLSALSLLAIPLQQLIVGGALTGVVVGIAAQQTLGNVFAGLMILLVRPFRVGDTIEVRSGALNGPFTGRVRALGLTYVTLAADNGTLLLPNAGVLAAGVTVGLHQPE
ncbi:mechanosensitive ion channel domain-containing protein [Kutzneria buriramensis]|uniref:Mechanosensitive ion channel-like protein n=1 Tax=Kutzneria buriramensis TaxID=1045776 RepID=A0A3E0H7N2_9PSEU|nr:mechanosensitive ion channel domain-containing protein [Kutzneria buriramensis]REH39422.1 mechanosensitive ion channel-like protein [Kutzneria buriramensis]